MKRDFLEGLGIEKEVIDKIMDAHGVSVEANKAKIETLEKAKTDLAAQLKDRDAQLDSLKKVDVNKLQQEIADLQTANKTKDESYKAEMAKIQKVNALKFALSGQVHDPDDIIKGLDLNALELDEKGALRASLDDLIKPIRESKPYLFVEQQDGTAPSVVSAKPAEPGKPPAVKKPPTHTIF